MTKNPNPPNRVAPIAKTIAPSSPPEAFTDNSNYDTIQTPDRGNTGDTTTATPTDRVMTNRAYDPDYDPKYDADGTKYDSNDDTVVTAADGSYVVTHIDGTTHSYDRNDNLTATTAGGNVDYIAEAEAEANRVAEVLIDTEREYPVNPRFPGEGNPDFKG